MCYRISQTLLLLFLFLPLSSFSQSVEEYEKLIESAREYERNQEFVMAIKVLSQAEILAADNHWDEKLCIVKNNLGNLYKYLSNYGVAMDYYTSSLNIARNLEQGEDKIPTILNNIGTLFEAEGQFSKAINHYEDAFLIAKKNKNESALILLATNLSNCLIEINKPKEARFYINSIENLPKNKAIEQILFINLAKTYFLEGNIDDALKMVEDKYPSCMSTPSECMQCTIGFLSHLHASQNNLDKAINLLLAGLKNNLQLHNRITYYESLSELYYKNSDLEHSIKYKDSVIYAKDSLTKLINRGLFESNKVKFQVQEYQNEVVQSKEKQKAERNLFIILILSGLVVGFFIYKTIQNKAIKHKQQKVIAENNEKIVTLELENVKNNLAEKNRKLSAKALYLSGRNELIEDIIQSLTNLKEVSNSKEISSYIRTLKSHLKTDAEWDEFIKHFESVNPEFLHTLKTKHPDLSPNDIRFICYVYMNLNLKEISIIFNITYNAARIRKRRVMEKMGLDKDGELYDYIIAV